MKPVHNEIVAVPAAVDRDGVGANGTLNRLFELSVLMAGYMEQSLAERGLTRARATVVWHLFHHGSMTQRQLSQALKVTPRNVTALLDALQDGGFVQRNPHPTDRRATMVSITTKGRRTANAMARDHEKFAGRLFEVATEDELNSFSIVLAQVLGRLRSITDGDESAE